MQEASSKNWGASRSINNHNVLLDACTPGQEVEEGKAAYRTLRCRRWTELNFGNDKELQTIERQHQALNRTASVILNQLY